MKPNIRFNGFNDDWVGRKLGDITNRVTRKNKDNESNRILTISAEDGLVDQIEYFNKQIASRDLSRYFLMKNGEFAYNKSYSNGHPWGAIKRLNKYDMGVLSSLYIVFQPKNIDSQFLVSYYDTTAWYKEVSMNATEGARNHGLLNIAPIDFFNTVLNVPTLPEQQKIGSLFSKYDNIIALREQKLEELNALKKGLLQQMFDDGGGDVHKPQVRFSGFNDEWVEKKLGDVFDVKRGKVLAKTDVSMMPTSENKYPVYSSQTKDSGRMGYTDTWLFEDGITWTTDGANAGTVNYRSGKFFSTNVNGVLLKKTSISNRFVAIAFGNVAKNHVTYIANPKLMSNVVSNIKVKVPTLPEQQKIGQLFKHLDERISNEQSKIDQLKAQKQGLLQRML